MASIAYGFKKEIAAIGFYESETARSLWVLEQVLKRDK